MPQREGRTIAVIPARGGSKGVPGKNVARVGGVPLVARAVTAAKSVESIDDVFVSTDDAQIADVAREAGAVVVERPADIAGDLASSEDALLHALDVIESQGPPVSTLVFLQATSPFIPADALGAAVERVTSGREDAVFSAYETHGFLWSVTPEGAVGVNHDPAHRPRRQDRQAQFEESGAFYVMDAVGFREARHRFFGRVGLEVVPAISGMEIDTPDELAVARALAPVLDSTALGPIDALIMDFDGVHTDDCVTVSQDGTEAVTVSRSDGMGIGMLREAGVPMLIVSTERNPVVQARGAKLGIETMNGIDDKVNVVRQWCEQRQIRLSNVAFIGNDVNDVASMQIVGWPIAVANAHPSATQAARVRLTKNGGHGALRELAELILLGKEKNNG